MQQLAETETLWILIELVYDITPGTETETGLDDLTAPVKRRKTITVSHRRSLRQWR